MTISFSGVGSGLPISDWIEALVEIEQDKIDTLYTKKETLTKKQSALNTLNSTYNSVKSSTQKFTDALHGSAADIFSKVSVTTSDSSIVTATVTQAATPAVVKLKVSQLATATERRSYVDDIFTDTSMKLSELNNTSGGTPVEIQAGSFKINDAIINVTPDMTVDSLVYTINNSTKANVKAHVEDGQLVLESLTQGAEAIVVEEINSNFVQLSGLHDDNYQTMGTNAKFSINGVEKEATTNQIGSDKTGILGLSLELMSITDGDDPINITISRDYDAEAVLAELQTFVTNFNKTINDTDTATTSDGGMLAGENSLVGIRNRLRTMITSTVNPNGFYKSLSDIGITSGAPGMDVNADTTALQIDENKFYEAFSANPAAVKALLIGDSTAAAGSSERIGLMQKVQDNLDTALDYSNGYFTARQTSLSSEISNLNNKISRKEDALVAYETRLTNQFNYMDQMIAQMNTQFEQMQQQLASIGVDVGSSS